MGLSTAPISGNAGTRRAAAPYLSARTGLKMMCESSLSTGAKSSVRIGAARQIDAGRELLRRQPQPAASDAALAMEKVAGGRLIRGDDDVVDAFAASRIVGIEPDFHGGKSSASVRTRLARNFGPRPVSITLTA